MDCINVFNKSIRGTSHIANGKPCQDYSISFSENGVQILVVCDGHGSETYFRSDVGAELAAEVTLDTLKEFSKSMGSNPFSKCSFSITAKPRKNPFVDFVGNQLRYEDMNDSQKRYAKQAQAYTEASSKCVKEQKLVNELLGQIYTQWKNRISIHRDSHPFSSSELSILNGKNIVKAYGCTLLAYLQTESYWLSFQIGDGRILFCNKNLSWASPIQEDCNCFLNYTTSLCDDYALDEFRYAFCGNGFFPFSVFLCSDGIEGSLRTEANIQDFYEQIIKLCADKEDVNAELAEYLPRLSEMGNKDDLSISGAVYLNKSNIDGLSKSLDIQRKKRSIQNEIVIKKNELDKILSKIEALGIKLSKHIDTRSNLKSVIDNFRSSIQSKEKEFSDNEDIISSLQKDIHKLQEELKRKEKDFNEWIFTVKNEIAYLEEESVDNEQSEDSIMSF